MADKMNPKHDAVLSKAAAVIRSRGHEGDARLADSVLGVLASLRQAENKRATPRSPSTAENEMPPLPQPMVKHYERPHGLQELQYFTAEMMRAYGQECARAALKKERNERRPRVKLDPELKAALDEAAKTRSTVALLPDGEPVFINYGDQPEDTAHLYCTACGGSGHIDDQRDLADRAALSANAADREAKDIAARTLEGTRL